MRALKAGLALAVLISFAFTLTGFNALTGLWESP